MVNVDASEAAPWFGAAVSIIVFVLGWISLFGGDVGFSIWTIVASTLMSVVEVPRLWSCTEKMSCIKEFTQDKLFMKNWYLRGTVYVLMSILMFIGGGWTLDLSGALVVCTALMYWFAQYQGLREEGGDGESYDQF
eukprot:g3872.t1